jgi:hypothetical protein
MQRYEYRVIPAPRRGEKSREARSTPERFALALTQIMNKMGAEGWDYLRTDTLPCEERVGLTGRQTTFQHMLVFRRPLAQAARLAAAPQAIEDLAPARATAGALPAAEPAMVHDSAEAIGLPESDPMDDAARRAGMIPPVQRPALGPAPRIGTAAPRRAPLLGALRALKPEGSGG